MSVCQIALDLQYDLRFRQYVCSTQKMLHQQTNHSDKNHFFIKYVFVESERLVFLKKKKKKVRT